MNSYILYLIFALLSAPASSRSLYPASDDEDGVTLDLQSVQNAGQILNILQDMNERSLDAHAPPRLYKNYRKPQGQPTTPTGEYNSKLNKEPTTNLFGEGNYREETCMDLRSNSKMIRTDEGIDLDYIGLSAEQYIDVNKLMRLVQKNYEANEDSVWTRAKLNPRVYYISNPEILEEYWRNLKRKDRSDPQYGYWRSLKEKDSSQAEHYDSRNQFGAGIDKNLLKFIISQRRDGDDNGEDIYVNDDNRIENNEEDVLNQQYKTKASNKVKLNSKDNPRNDKEVGPVSFKSHDDYYDEKKIEKKKPKFNNKSPAKGRDRGDKSTESFKSAWKIKKASNYREPVRTSKRYDDPPERSIYSYSKPRLAKDRGRNKGNMGGYQAYGRTPVPIVGKRGIYEDD